jgi:zinc protease
MTTTPTVEDLSPVDGPNDGTPVESPGTNANGGPVTDEASSETTPNPDGTTASDASNSEADASGTDAGRGDSGETGTDGVDAGGSDAAETDAGGADTAETAGDGPEVGQPSAGSPAAASDAGGSDASGSDASGSDADAADEAGTGAAGTADGEPAAGSGEAAADGSASTAATPGPLLAGVPAETAESDEAPAALAKAVPELGPVPRPKQPVTAERTLASGLRVIAVRRPGVPLVELRLRVPFGGTAATLPARSLLLGETLLSGTAERSQVELAAALQSLGAELHASVDADRLLIGGTVLRTGLTTLLGLLADVLTGAAYPNREVTGERGRLVERLSIARSQPSVLVREALRRRLFGDHPYARELPSVEDVAAVTPPQLRRLHADRVSPDGSVLVLVGDVTPGRVLDQVESALGGWDAVGSARPVPALPAVEPGPIVLVDRPGSVQSSIRLGGPAVSRADPMYAALQLANLAFGGNFSSRLVENIREDKGYTYGPHSRIDHAGAGSTLIVDADVATGVTAPALLEIWYELGRMATLPISENELTDVRQYAIGTLALSLASQSGLASTLTALAGHGLGLDWLREHPNRLAAVTLDDAYEAARTYLAPSRMVTVLLGDAGEVAGAVGTLGGVTQLAAGS